jgi:hypothetical protein
LLHANHDLVKAPSKVSLSKELLIEGENASAHRTIGSVALEFLQPSNYTSI